MNMQSTNHISLIKPVVIISRCYTKSPAYGVRYVITTKQKECQQLCQFYKKKCCKELERSHKMIRQKGDTMELRTLGTYSKMPHQVSTRKHT